MQIVKALATQTQHVKPNQKKARQPTPSAGPSCRLLSEATCCEHHFLRLCCRQTSAMEASSALSSGEWSQAHLGDKSRARTKAVCRHGPSLLLPNHSVLDCTRMFPSHRLLHLCMTAVFPCQVCLFPSGFMGHYWHHYCIPVAAFLQLVMGVRELLQALLGWDMALVVSQLQCGAGGSSQDASSLWHPLLHAVVTPKAAVAT